VTKTPKADALRALREAQIQAGEKLAVAKRAFAKAKNIPGRKVRPKPMDSNADQRPGVRDTETTGRSPRAGVSNISSGVRGRKKRKGKA
jgi:hypothetical protein